MKAVCTAAEVRELDRRAIEGIGLPGAVLMETAGRGLAEVIRARFSEAARGGVVVVCGPGNNGGDGYVAARWLHGWGLAVSTWSLADRSEGDAALHRAACLASGVPEGDGLGRCGLIVDAIFGTGLGRPVTGRFAEVVLRMETHPAPIVAADLPTGLNADTGAVLGGALTAACTVTFGRLKRGLLCGEGPERAGLVEVIDLGFDVVERESDAELPDAADLAPLWPLRSSGDHKGSSGHLLVIAGSTAMAGAAVLTCRGALAAGAGLITLMTPRGALPRLGALPPEVMVVVAGAADVVELSRLPDLGRYRAVAAGPGLGGGQPLPPHTEMALAALWSSATQPCVFDADALMVCGRPVALPRVITPHPGEAGRLLGVETSAVQGDRFEAAARLCGGGVVALLKGRHTLVASAGEAISVNPSGSPVLATGGSGDVLTGLIGGLLARGVAPRDAARLGAWVHGRAGERLASRRAEGWRASDVAEEIPAAVADLLTP